jgi:3-oxoacyl-[acyl-carrier protein] reductase
VGPMAGGLPYAVSKGAVHQMTLSLADALADRAITVNAINPGPVDTGWPSEVLRERLRNAFPRGRWGTPADIAAIVSWLAGADSAWITGQVINAEGGFRR